MITPEIAEMVYNEFVADVLVSRSELRKVRERLRKYCGNHPCLESVPSIDEQRRVRAMEDALIRLYVEAVLSEGQVVKMTGLDRVTVRERADAIGGIAWR